MTQEVDVDAAPSSASDKGRQALPIGAEFPAIVRFEVRTPTLPPATQTNAYILGEGELVVVDPASPYLEEQAALARVLTRRTQAGERVTAIFLSHQHVDHVSGALALQALTAAPIWAHAETAARLLGRIPVDHLVAHGEQIPAGGLELEAILTPGHAPGHLCLLEHGSRALICGDMVASVGTILIDVEDDGDMTSYLESLAAMRALRPRCLLPAHGPPIGQADAHLAYYLAHRQAREAKIRAALTDEAQPLDTLVVRTYDDVSPAIHPLARRSLRAHLEKLRKDGAALESEAGWQRG